MTRIRSTLTFASKEGFQTRAFLVELLEEKETILGSFQNEKKAYAQLAGSPEEGIRFSKAFSSEMIFNLKKAIRQLSPEENEEFV